MQCHYMLMEGLVGQQQILLSRLVEVMEGKPEDGLENAPGNELGNGAGMEDGTEEEA
ncbi:hypothetical protein ID866_12018 [Astraeus odoratus]|nr:hypothetical protein ID866_12018 [Astraeus odoratus]